MMMKLIAAFAALTLCHCAAPVKLDAGNRHAIYYNVDALSEADAHTVRDAAQAWNVSQTSISIIEDRDSGAPWVYACKGKAFAYTFRTDVVLHWQLCDTIIQHETVNYATDASAITFAVAIHEFGHGMGLPHNSGDSVMHADITPDQVQAPLPTATDVANIIALWH